MVFDSNLDSNRLNQLTAHHCFVVVLKPAKYQE